MHLLLSTSFISNKIFDLKYFTPSIIVLYYNARSKCVLTLPVKKENPQ